MAAAIETVVYTRDQLFALRPVARDRRLPAGAVLRVHTLGLRRRVRGTRAGRNKQRRIPVITGAWRQLSPGAVNSLQQRPIHKIDMQHRSRDNQTPCFQSNNKHTRTTKSGDDDVVMSAQPTGSVLRTRRLPAEHSRNSQEHRRCPRCRPYTY